MGRAAALTGAAGASAGDCAADAGGGDDFDAYVQADIDFHLLLAEASGNSILGNMLVNMRALLQTWSSRVIHRAGETASSLAMHEPDPRCRGESPTPGPPWKRTWSGPSEG